MSRLFFLMMSLSGPSMAGAGVVIALTTGMVSLKAILLAAAAGYALSLPVALFVTRRLQG